MKILIVSQYYYPEDVAAAVWMPQLAKGLAEKGHDVVVLTAFPNYPKRIVCKGYRGKLFQREWIDGIRVIRTWIYASPRETYLSRVLNWGSFCLTSFLGGILAVHKPDMVYAVLPPLPLGVFAVLLARIKGARVVCCVEDIYPLIAMELGILKNPLMIWFFRRMERWIYRHTDGLIGISEGFKRHFLEAGADGAKISVIPNWADTSVIRPGSKTTPFRREYGLEGRFVVLYSGNLSYNSSVDSLIEAAGKLENHPVTILIVGDGVRRNALEAKVKSEGFPNVLFVPFQPLPRYPEVLASADLTVVTLNTPATLASVPSKIFKQMAAGRPILAVTEAGNELERMVIDHRMGICVSPRDPAAIAAGILSLLQNPRDLNEMGENARRAVEGYYSRERCVGLIESAIRRAAN
jgi:colanic acid biosynthesis glycosyl transferase WcaI